MDIRLFIYREQRPDRTQHWLHVEKEGNRIPVAIRIEDYEFDTLQAIGIPQEQEMGWKDDFKACIALLELIAVQGKKSDNVYWQVIAGCNQKINSLKHLLLMYYYFKELRANVRIDKMPEILIESLQEYDNLFYIIAKRNSVKYGITI